MKSFKEFLEEAILFSDIEDIRQHISPAFIKIFGNKGLTRWAFYKALNDALNDINIFVYESDENINGMYDYRTERINLYIPLKYYRLVANNEISQSNFFHQIEKSLEHELIHKKQQERDKRERPKAKYKWYDDRTPKFWKQYLSDKNEVMAFARSIVELYKADGLSKDEINDALKSLNMEKYPNRILERYLSVFDKTDPTIKRILSYVYQYNEKLGG